MRTALTSPLAALSAALLALVPTNASAAGLFEANHPLVKQGTDAYQKGDYEAALKAYEQAERELPDSPELQYNLGDVYMKLKRADDAKRAYETALKKAPDSLKSRDYFNLGNALAELNQKDDAVSAYRQALKVDPKNEPARRNLELLLRNKNEKKNPSPTQGDGGLPPDGGRDGGAPDSGGQDGGQSKDNPDAANQGDGGSDGGVGDGGASDGGKSDGGGDGGSGDGGGQGDGGSQGDGGRQDGGADGGSKDDNQDQNDQPDGGSQDAGQQDGGTPPPTQEPEKPKNLDKQEAERLLDAIRRNEKQFLMQQHKKAKQRARPKDW
ncbi:MAG: tetratricopeptide repeat protein [Myxococcales bacterium]